MKKWLVGALALLSVSLCGSVEAQTNPDSIYTKALALGLPRLPAPMVTHYSRGYERRAAALQRGARKVRELLIDSVGVKPDEVVLLVLDDSDWAQVTEMPYGLTLLLKDPPVFLAPAEVDHGIYHPDDLPEAEAEFNVDRLGLFYLAHFFAVEALYQNGHQTDHPVKWLGELFTLMLEDDLFGAIDPKLREAAQMFDDVESLKPPNPRVTTLAGFDREFRGYFVTQEGVENFIWFLARLDRWAREIRQAHGLGAVRRVRNALAASPAEIDTESALELLDAVGIDIGGWN